jgi:HK97 family phage major capsid protein
VKLLSKKISLIFQFIAVITFVIAYNLFRRTGFGQFSVPLRTCVVAEEKEESLDKQILRSLGGLNDRLKQLDEMQKTVTKNAADYEIVTKITAEVKAELDAFRRSQIGIKGRHTLRAGEAVSEDCARWLGAVACATALAQHKLASNQEDMAMGVVKDVLGIQTRASIGTGDMPLPTQYVGDIVELVYTYGQARKLGTVFPMGAITVKLPKLTTDTTFGLIAMSGSVTEKSPQFAWVTFNAEKFGGLIRLPSEIDQDSIVTIGQFLARYAARNMARAEDNQFFLSDGSDAGLYGAGPGLVKAVVTDTCTYIQGGSASSTKTHGTDASLADFRNLRGASGLSGVVLNRAQYYLHPTYEAQLVSFNTSATVTPYIRATNGQPATLDGFPVQWVSVMPVLSAASTPTTVVGLFGDATYQYLGTREGIRFDTSAEAAFTTDEILVRALERMTVGYMASKAVAGLVTSTT